MDKISRTNSVYNVKHIEFLVEEYSAKIVLLNILPKILPRDINFEIRSFRGKSDLLKKLPQRLNGYKSWLPKDWRIVILCDRDDDNCLDLKQKLDFFARSCNLTTKTSTSTKDFNILNRIIIEELEAWFIGDPQAITQAYPRISATFSQRKPYRNPDMVKGGTWEALQRLLQNKGYFSSGLNKLEAAQNISKYMDPTLNRSPSFQCFISGLSFFCE